jgi:DNA-binding MarR family transcriptional regulator
VAEQPRSELDESLISTLDTLVPRYLRELRSAIADAEGPDRLTMPQVRCLQASKAAGESGATTSRLAEFINVTVPTMSSMVDGLASRSMVERRNDPTNRRRVLLFVTPQGIELLDRYQGIMDRRHRSIIGGLSEASKKRLLTAAADLLDRIDRGVTP